MINKSFDTLSEATNALTKEGYKEDFKAEEHYIKGLYNKKEFKPKNLKIVASYRFEGDTNPEDETELFALIADDGTKGTLIMSYSANHFQNTELIRQLKTID